MAYAGDTWGMVLVLLIRIDCGEFRHLCRFMLAVIRTVRTQNIDIMIQAYAGMARFVCARVARGSGKKFVYRAVNAVNVDQRINTRLKPCEHYTCEMGLPVADASICQNDSKATQLSEESLFQFEKAPGL